MHLLPYSFLTDAIFMKSNHKAQLKWVSRSILFLNCLIQWITAMKSRIHQGMCLGTEVRCHLCD